MKFLIDFELQQMKRLLSGFRLVNKKRFSEKRKLHKLALLFFFLNLFKYFVTAVEFSLFSHNQMSNVCLTLLCSLVKLVN